MWDGRPPIEVLDRSVIARRLEDVRDRTLSLVAVLDWEVLRRQHLPILSPMVWDLGHVGNFEELWLNRRLGGLEPIEDGYEKMFTAVVNPRPTREGLPLPGSRRLYEYLEEVRRRTFDVLEGLDSSSEPELLKHGFVYELVAEHEEQHQETLLQAMQILEDPAYEVAQRRRLPDGGPVGDGMVLIPGGPFEMGHSGEGFSYDNEKRRHQVQVDAFLIDRAPVTNGEYRGFVEEGGYGRRQFWSRAGWQWRAKSGAGAPANWRRGKGRWELRYMNREIPLPENRPVIHVCYYEAEAFARFAGKRLPTEAEWEKAALWDPVAGRARRFPWGDEPPTPERANLDQLAFEPAEVGAYPEGVSAYGVHQMVGDVWEWTNSDFRPFPGFAAFPYREYSEIFFGDEYRVLRGGSWATRPAVVRGTFRNWDFPNRRQIFSGFRCARDPD